MVKLFDPYANFETAILPNGLSIHALHYPQCSTQALGFMVHSGAKEDPIGMEGLSHFTEHLVSCNCSLSLDELKNVFDSWGGNYALGNTKYFSTDYRLFVPAEKKILAQAFDLFGQMLITAKLRRGIKRERQVILEEIARKITEKNLKRQLQINRDFYGNFWRSRFYSPFGSIDFVKSAKQADLQMNYDRHYTPANISIVSVGHLNVDQLAKLLVNSPFGNDKAGTRTPLEKPLLTISPSIGRYQCYTHEEFGRTSDTVCYFNRFKLPGNISYRALMIFKSMLEHLLFKELREKRSLTYDVNIHYEWLSQLHYLQIFLESRDATATEEINLTIDRSIASLTGRTDLFERFKDRRIKNLKMNDPSNRGIADEAMDDLRSFQRIVSIKEIIEQYRRVNMNDINKLIGWLTPEMKTTLVIY
jgi:predicted Zn-dependent peptidase